VDLEKTPFQLAGGRNPLILLPASVNEKGPYDFVLDTGASTCLLTPNTASLAGIKTQSEQDALGAGGGVKVALGRAATIAVGSAAQQNLQVALTTEIDRIAAAVGANIDGVLGFNYLKDFRFTLDYQRNTLLLQKSAERAPGGQSTDEAPVPFRLAAPAKPLILVDVLANGEGPFSFAVDTGASRTMVHPDIAKRLSMPVVDAGHGTAGGGQIKLSSSRLGSLTVGHVTVKDHAVGVGDFLNLLSIMLGERLDGIVGYNFLRQFLVTIDYPRAALEFAAVV
jgi:predicted aspartyl protease